jgi:hypothetical protein
MLIDYCVGVGVGVGAVTVLALADRAGKSDQLPVYVHPLWAEAVCKRPRRIRMLSTRVMGAW